MKSGKNWLRKLSLGAVIILLVLAIVFTAKNQQALRFFSNQLSIKMQQTTGVFWRWWFCFASESFFYALLVGHFGLLFYMREKNCAVKIFLFIQLTGYFVYIIKLVTQDARPSLDTEAIAKISGCNCSFGMPSVHVTLSVLFYPMLYKELILRVTERVAFKILWLVFFAIIICNTFVSSLFCGSSYLDQILIGAFVGLMVFSAVLLFESSIDMAMQSVIDFIPRHNERKIITCFSVIIPSFSLFLLSWMLWKRRSSEQPKWYFNTQCSFACKTHEWTLADRDLLACGLYTSALLLFLMLMFFSKGVTFLNPFYYSESLTGLTRLGKRLLVFFTVVLPLILGQLLAHFVKAWAAYLIQIVGASLFAFLFVFCTKSMLQYFGVDVSGDFFVDKGFDILEATGSEVEFVETLNSEMDRRVQRNRI